MQQSNEIRNEIFLAEYRRNVIQQLRKNMVKYHHNWLITRADSNNRESRPIPQAGCSRHTKRKASVGATISPEKANGST